jgi:hypothetical protein
VLLSTVDSLDVVDVDPAVAITIKFVEGLSDELLSLCGKGSSDTSQELIVVESATAIVIEVGEKSTNFSVTEAKHVIFHGLSEFVKVKAATVIIIHNAERFAETNNSTSSTSS